jgi:hypothetical protein
MDVSGRHCILYLKDESTSESYLLWRLIPFFSRRRERDLCSLQTYLFRTLFKTMGFDYDMHLIMSGELNITLLIGVSTSIWTMDALRRRLLLPAGPLGMTISHIIIAILVCKFDNDWPAHRPEGWASAVFLLVHMVCFGATWGPVPWAMPSEIFHPLSASKGGSIVNL